MDTDKILGQIGAMQTLVENFPMSLLDYHHGKVYTSVFEFLVDVLKSFGIDVNEYIAYLINEIYGIQSKVEGGLENLLSDVKNGTANIDDQGKFMTGLEYSIKSILISVLSSIFSCSALPVIPDSLLDLDNLSYTNESGDTLSLQSEALKALIKSGNNGLVFSKNMIDPFNMLDTCPTTEEGILYYSIGGNMNFYRKVKYEDIDGNANYYYYEKCKRKELESDPVQFAVLPKCTEESESSIAIYTCDNGLTSSTLYKSMDMNAFIWYVLHKGMKNTDVEYNKMMWDSRVNAARKGYSFTDDDKWNEWYNSKPEEGDEFSGTTKFLFPVMQMEPVGDSMNKLKVTIPSQKYCAPKTRKRIKNEIAKSPLISYNSTLYEYNWDYLNSIQILHPKIMVVEMIESLLGLSLDQAKSTRVSLIKNMVETKVRAAIKTIVELDDMNVEDCYMSFSNDEFNAMMEEMMNEKYSSVISKNGSAIKTHDIDDYLDSLDTVNFSASANGTTETITKIVTNVSTTDTEEGYTDYSARVIYDENILAKLLWAITMPIVESLFTPQIMLLIMLNFEIMGITSADDVLGINDLGKVMNTIINKMLGLIKSIILYVKDLIIQMLLKLFYEKIMPLLVEWAATLQLEQAEAWLRLITEALACVPIFKLKWHKNLSEIDDVNYADITNNNDTPESSKNC